MIDIVPWKTKELAWRGMGTKTIGEYNSDKQQKCIDAVVAKILKRFPAKVKVILYKIKNQSPGGKSDD